MGKVKVSAAINSYRDLNVWQDAVNLAVEVYGLTRTFPKEEMYGMTAQMRRASVSIAANIAEGHGREQTGSFIQFLRVSQGSLKELETHLYLSEQVGLAPSQHCAVLTEQCESLGRRLRALIRSLQERVAKED